jgi:hypothetical protein
MDVSVCARLHIVGMLRTYITFSTLLHFNLLANRVYIVFWSRVQKEKIIAGAWCRPQSGAAAAARSLHCSRDSNVRSVTEWQQLSRDRRIQTANDSSSSCSHHPQHNRQFPRRVQYACCRCCIPQSCCCCWLLSPFHRHLSMTTTAAATAAAAAA